MLDCGFWIPISRKKEIELSKAELFLVREFQRPKAKITFGIACLCTIMRGRQ